MNRTRFSLVVLAACASAAVLAWTRKAEIPDSHRQLRQLVVQFTLNRVDNPVIVLGDSLVEASTLPRSICGHAIVNAGLGGASTASDLGGWLAPALGGKPVALIVLALGTNDALSTTARDTPSFERRYGALLALLSTFTPRLVVLEIPPVEAQGRVTAEMQDQVMKTIDMYNAILPDLARRNGAAFAALPAMPTPHTIDGVHLNSGGYLAWDKAIMQAAATVCG